MHLTINVIISHKNIKLNFKKVNRSTAINISQINLVMYQKIINLLLTQILKIDIFKFFFFFK